MRSVCAHLGLSIDVNLPTECDDEYWLGPEGEPAFKQPLGKPCKVSGFVHSLRLAKLLAVAARTIVSEKPQSPYTITLIV